MKTLSTALVIAGLISLSSQSYNTELGMKGLWYSAAAYCAYETLDDWNCGAPCQNLGDVDQAGFVRINNVALDTFGYAGYNNKNNEIFLAFRGTNGVDFENWVTNIKFLTVPYPEGGTIHRGFYQDYQAV